MEHNYTMPLVQKTFILVNLIPKPLKNENQKCSAAADNSQYYLAD